ncbi:MAG: 3-phosphoshikimate 1-carboxyvinyltransferase [Desulfobacterales bacterium]
MQTITPRPLKPENCVAVPGSKSFTHRMLIAAALAAGGSRLENPLHSEDTTLTARALGQLGAAIATEADGTFVVTGTGGRLSACREPLYLGNSGTSMRLLTAVAALGRGSYRLTGTERMGSRPIAELVHGLVQIGVPVQTLEKNGCPPLTVTGGSVRGGKLSLDCRLSSQYLSALLLIAPYTVEGLDIAITAGPVSRPYIDMTVATMETFGVAVKRDGYQHFRVDGGQLYRAGCYRVEADASQAGYFWAAAALTGTTITVRGTARSSLQGDSRFIELLAAMGCRVAAGADGITVSGGPLCAISADMGDMPDMVPTLAVVAAFARGTTTIRNVAHLKAKESDRIAAVVRELNRMGVSAQARADGMTVTGGQPAGAVIDTYDDHRIAMSFALAGLKTPGVVIRDPGCVKKSFPNYWRVFETLFAP